MTIVSYSVPMSENRITLIMYRYCTVPDDIVGEVIDTILSPSVKTLPTMDQLLTHAYFNAMPALSTKPVFKVGHPVLLWLVRQFIQSYLWFMLD